MDCVRGCINYIKDQRRSEMKVIPNPKDPEIIYNVMIKGNHEIADKLFNCSTPNKILYNISHKNTKEYKFVVQGKDDVQEREFEFILREPNEKDEYKTTDKIRNNIPGCGCHCEEGAQRPTWQSVFCAGMPENGLPRLLAKPRNDKRWLVLCLITSNRTGGWA